MKRQPRIPTKRMRGHWIRIGGCDRLAQMLHTISGKAPGSIKRQLVSSVELAMYMALADTTLKCLGVGADPVLLPTEFEPL